MRTNQTGKAGLLVILAIVVAAVLFFLFGTQAGRALISDAEDVTKSTMDKAGDVAGAAGSMVKDGADATKAMAGDAMDKAGDVANAAGTMVKDGANATKAMAGDAMDKAGDVASAAGTMVKDGANATKAMAGDAMDKAGDVMDKAGDVMDKATEMSEMEKAKAKAMEMAKDELKKHYCVNNSAFFIFDTKYNIIIMQ